MRREMGGCVAEHVCETELVTKKSMYVIMAININDVLDRNRRRKNAPKLSVGVKFNKLTFSP